MNRTNEQGHEQDNPQALTHSISPGVPCSEPILVVLMTTGSYLLVGYPQAGPTALVIQDGAGPLRQALEAAFGPGHPTEESANGKTADEAANRNGTGTNKNTSSKAALLASPGSGPIRTTQVHS